MDSSDTLLESIQDGEPNNNSLSRTDGTGIAANLAHSKTDPCSLFDYWKKTILPLAEKGKLSACHLLNYLQLVNAEFKRHHSLDYYTNRLALTKDHLEEICRSEIKCSPLRILHTRIIGEAIKLLDQGHITIGDLADELGFHDANYFSRLFKNLIGVSPRQYRKMKW